MNIKSFFKNTPLIFGLLYLADIFLFSLIYYLFFNTSFLQSNKIDLLSSIYFSTSTITTLGYGDLTANRQETLLLVAVIAQSLSGVVLIGLFLNSISNRISDAKDAKHLENLLNKKRSNDKKILTILRPTIENHLQILAETYKVTATEIGSRKTIKPEQLFDQEFIDQISLQNFYSYETRYGSGAMSWAEFLSAEHASFKNSLENFLIKFIPHIDIDLIEIINKLQNSNYLGFANAALDELRRLRPSENTSRLFSILQFEHSSYHDEPHDMNAIKDHCQFLLSVIHYIDMYFPDNELMINLYLDNGSAPAVGSARASLLPRAPSFP